MKVKLCLIFAAALVVLTAITFEPIAFSQYDGNTSLGNEEAFTFSTQPLDDRYRLILQERDVVAYIAISERTNFKKNELKKMLIEVARKYELEPALILAVATQESRLDPYARSHMGAMGLMQLMPATARSFGVKNIFDPRQNAEGGARYIRFLLGELDNDIELTLAAYNAGMAPVLQYNGIPPFTQTQVFVERVLQFRDEYRQEIK